MGKIDSRGESFGLIAAAADESFGLIVGVICGARQPKVCFQPRLASKTPPGSGPGVSFLGH